MEFRIQFYSTGTSFGADSGNRIMLDNFSLTQVTAVPEPGTYAAIFGAIALGMAAWRRRRQRGVA